MPIDSNGNYALPSGYLGVSGSTILTTQHNPPLEDIAAALTACVKRNGAGAMTGLLTLSGDPASAMQAATKQYVDAAAASAVTGIKSKPSVLCATTANITLVAEQTIDGQLTAASRVLVKNQTAPAENGIYVTGSGAWSRATDFDAWTEVPGAVVAVENGTLWADTVWLCTADAGGTIGSTSVTWRRADASIRRRADTTTALTVTNDDFGSLVTTSNAAAVAVTVPQATGVFGLGFWFIHQNLGAGTATDTPTTSTVNGSASLAQQTNDAYLWVSDGTNWRAIPLGQTLAQTNATKWPLGYLSGLTLARTGTTTFSIATGACANEDGGTQFDMNFTSAFTKTLSAWAAGTGNGSLDTGTIAATTWYHVHLIRKTSDGSLDVLLSLSATAPTMPSGYVARRRIGSILTNGSSQIVDFDQTGDRFNWKSPVVDVNVTNAPTTAVNRVVSVPTGLVVEADLSVGIFPGNGTQAAAYLSPLAETDIAPQSGTTASLTAPADVVAQTINCWSFVQKRVLTDTAATIRSRISATGAAQGLGIITYGWIDTRGKK